MVTCYGSEVQNGEAEVIYGFPSWQPYIRVDLILYSVITIGNIRSTIGDQEPYIQLHIITSQRPHIMGPYLDMTP